MCRIGDVLLTTPLIRTLKSAWPQASVDVLVFANTESVLASNPDIRRIITIARQPAPLAHLCLLGRIFRKYDLAISTQTADRPTFYAYWAGKQRIGMRDKKPPLWKRWLLSESVVFDGRNTHTVLMNGQLATLLGLAARSEVVVHWNGDDMVLVNELLDIHGQGRQFAVLHPVPRFNYKKWHAQGWRDVAGWLHQKDMLPIFTGSGESSEAASIKDIIAPLAGRVVNVAGKLSLSQTAYLISKSQLYVGPDTVTTHMAAAVGVPTIALFGPSNPVAWGPWPKNWPSRNPYTVKGSQLRNNVMILQGEGECVPCFMEGCDRHIASSSECLTRLPSWRVIAAGERLLQSARALD